MTPRSKRKSILVRMLRPVSVAFGEWPSVVLFFYCAGATDLINTETEPESGLRVVLHCGSQSWQKDHLHSNCYLFAAEMEFDLDKALEEVPIHVEDPPPPPPPAQPLDRISAYYGDLPPPPTPLDVKAVRLSELPSAEPVTLQHRTKFRPKPKKRTKPSRPRVGFCGVCDESLRRVQDQTPNLCG